MFETWPIYFCCKRFYPYFFISLESSCTPPVCPPPWSTQGFSEPYTHGLWGLLKSGSDFFCRRRICFFGIFNITWRAVFGHVSVFFFLFVFLRLSVICVCFSPFCDLYTYISLWNSGKSKLAVAQRRIQTLFWRDFLEVMRRKAEVALLQKHGLNDANPDCLIVLVCQGAFKWGNRVSWDIPVPMQLFENPFIFSWSFLVTFHGYMVGTLPSWWCDLPSWKHGFVTVCMSRQLPRCCEMRKSFFFLGGAMDIHPSKLHKKQWFLKAVRGSWLNEFLL